MKRFIVCLALAALFFSLIYFLGVSFESYYLLENWFDVSPLPNVKQGVWLSAFQEVASVNAYISLAFAIIWNCVGFFVYRINDWSRAGGKLAWWIIGILMCIAIGLYGRLYTPQSQDMGKMLAILIYLSNGIVIYWLSSFLLSPASVKYVPPFSKYAFTQRISLNF